MPVFSEAPAWSRVGRGWRQLFGSFRGQGLSFEWHDFMAEQEFDWSATFHPESVELCLNLAGEGRIGIGRSEAVLGPQCAGFYCRTGSALRAVRAKGQRHQFVTAEISFAFLREHLALFEKSLHPLVQPIVTGEKAEPAVSEVTRLTARQQHLLLSLREPPILAAAQPLWYRTKALELASEFFFVNPSGGEMFCQRQHRLAAERVEKVIGMLRRDLTNPPALEDISRAVGCSAFHLSRTFSTEMGMTIPQYIRQLRMERAAELLRDGNHNVTEVALEVGYSSPSHFSLAFHQAYGCCPGLYPWGKKGSGSNDPVPGIGK